jgi:hypothetical protein
VVGKNRGQLAAVLRKGTAAILGQRSPVLVQGTPGTILAESTAVSLGTGGAAEHSHQDEHQRENIQDLQDVLCVTSVRYCVL